MSDPVITITSQPFAVLVRIGYSASFTVVAQADQACALAYQWYKDGQAITGATSATYSIASVLPEDSNVYHCRVSCNVGTNFAISNRAYLASTLLDAIELEMKCAILVMTKTGGYNWDWASVNQPDEAVGIGYPRAIIQSPKEDCLDDPNGTSGGAYSNQVEFVIYVIAEQLLQTFPNPNFTIRSHLRLALDDLKKLFGMSREGYSLGGICDNVMYRNSLIVKSDKNDVQRPAVLQSNWIVKYAQDRITPLQYASG